MLNPWFTGILLFNTYYRFQYRFKVHLVLCPTWKTRLPQPIKIKVMVAIAALNQRLSNEDIIIKIHF